MHGHGVAHAPAVGSPSTFQQLFAPDDSSSVVQEEAEQDELFERLQAVEQFILHTMTPDPKQLEDWVTEIIPNVTFPASAGPVRKPNRDRVAVAS